MSEIDAGRMDAATIKRLTGNDYVQAEAKYSNEIFEGRPQFTTVLAANNAPKIDHSDEALNERILALPFKRTIDRSARKYDRQTQIENHSGVAVLSWLVEGWKMYCAEGLSNPPEVVYQAQREMVSGLNNTQGFINDVLERADDCEDGRRALQRANKKATSKGRTKIGIADLDKAWTPPASYVYEKYKRWCNANGVDPISHPELTRDLGLGRPEPRLFEEKVQRCYKGVRIKDFDEPGGHGWRVK
jgi:phage/plasmid-associated DNA primase